ncbi:MAG: polysaccharide biosynthesis/export family protein [Pseudomonadota bacterium]
MGEIQTLRILAVSLLLFTAVACATSGGAPQAPASVAQANIGQLNDYKLGPSDKIRLIVYGEPELSGEFSVNARGDISIPLLGEIAANGLTIEGLKAKITAGLAEGFVNDARVAAEVIEYRPYYILGEIGKPGEYPYSAGMTVMKAVAAAEGFTYRARKSSVYIKRADQEQEYKFELTPDLVVYPGDVVRVAERFF